MSADVCAALVSAHAALLEKLDSDEIERDASMPVSLTPNPAQLALVHLQSNAACTRSSHAIAGLRRRHITVCASLFRKSPHFVPLYTKFALSAPLTHTVLASALLSHLGVDAPVAAEWRAAALRQCETALGNVGTGTLKFLFF